jgi:CheY-like chemotaxis protein
MNLAVNARDAMPDGGTLTIETANVVLEASRVAEPEDVPPGRYVALTVSDTGIGMGRETRSRIFEPFFTTKAPGTGTGLGLATVFAIVRQANGHISVASRPGRGSTFEIHFPSVDASPPQRVVERSDTPGGCETVLLVEDQPQVRALAARVLRRAGYVVLEASTGSEALLLAEGSADRIDLLLTDVVLPLMNGRQVAERIRALRPAVKVLFTSGYTGDVAPQPGLLDLGSAFLQKPFTASGLTRAVREVLDRPGRT